MQMFVAWVEKDSECISDRGIDIGLSRKWKTVFRPVACAWLNRTTKERDIEKAVDFVRRDEDPRKKVIVFLSEGKTLEDAKTKALELFESKEVLHRFE
jgi:hypothetical protein